MPLVKDIDNAISDNQRQIQALEATIGELQRQRSDLEAFKKLLYASGQELEAIFAQCLEMLGGKVTSARYSQEEFVLEIDGNTCLVECKGITKSVSLTHVRQLTDYMLKYEEDEGRSGKGILLGNAWRELAPGDRGLSGTPIFPENVVKRATALEMALVSSIAFFDAFCRFLNGQVQGDSILRKLLMGVGIVEFVEHESPDQDTQA